MHARPGPTTIWLGRNGLLFNRGQLIGAYYPARHMIVYEPKLPSTQAKHVFKWAVDMKTDALPEPDFHKNLVTELASIMHALDMTFNPR